MSPRLCVSVLLAGLAVAIAAGQAPPERFPPALESFLSSDVHLSAAERRALLGGSVVGKLLPGDAAKDVSVFAAVWIAGSPREYLAKLNDIERFERGGGFRITRRIGDPPSPEDFAAMPLIDEDFKDLRKCRIGDCEVKLDAAAIHRFRTEIPWDSANARPQAEALFRQHALRVVHAYREGGNARLPAYADRGDPMTVQDELRAVLDRAPALALVPALRDYLLNYPKAALPGATDFLYWQQVQFGLKPTIRINHLVIHERPGATVVASKMLYASHYFWTALELRVLLPDEARGRGFWFVTVSRSRPDGLSGFIGRMIRGRVRSEALKGTLGALRSTKSLVEAASR